MPNDQCNPDGLIVAGPLALADNPHAGTRKRYVWIDFGVPNPAGVSKVRRVVVGPTQANVTEFAKKYAVIPEPMPKGSCECGRGSVVNAAYFA